MSYDRHFIGENAHEEALQSVVDWCSPKQLMILRQALAGGMNFRRFRITCSFVGFRGYPVSAMLREFHPRYVRRFGPKSLQSEDCVAESYPTEEFK